MRLSWQTLRVDCASKRTTLNCFWLLRRGCEERDRSYRESGELLCASGAHQTHEDQQRTDAHPDAVGLVNSKLRTVQIHTALSQTNFFFKCVVVKKKDIVKVVLHKNSQWWRKTCWCISLRRRLCGHSPYFWQNDKPPVSLTFFLPSLSVSSPFPSLQ